MRFRRAATLSTTLKGGEGVVLNFLTQDRFSCSSDCLGFLAKLDDWHTGKDLYRYFPDVDGDAIAEQLAQLINFNAIVVEGTLEAKRDETYRKQWQWGATAGLFHFGVRNTPFIVSAKKTRKAMQSRRALRPSPPLYQSNRGKPKTKLPKTDTDIALFDVMRRRRTNRHFDGNAISLDALSDCLFAGNGIVDFFEMDADFGRLPKAMTPSGGARNPFELYVYARSVSGLKTGFYHYAALTHDLGRVRSGEVSAPEMLAGQKWAAKASVIVFLVAHFPRTMWKYHMPLSYRIVMMEAGFICQNIALAATYHKLSAVPSGALKEPVIEGYIDTPPIESAVVFSISIGRPEVQSKI